MPEVVFNTRIQQCLNKHTKDFIHIVRFARIHAKNTLNCVIVYKVFVVDAYSKLLPLGTKKDQSPDENPIFSDLNYLCL